MADAAAAVRDLCGGAEENEHSDQSRSWVVENKGSGGKEGHL